MSSSNSSKGVVLIIALVVIVLAVVIYKEKAPLGIDQVAPAGTDTPIVSDEEAAKIAKRVEELLVLPEADEPLVAKVVDAATLIAEQPFYAGVENGDYLLIYSSVSKAVIYSVKKDQLLNVGPLQVNPAVEPETVE